jgi:trk system potassium uptake protein TrkA
MRVVIIGAGEVGWYLAQRLGQEDHDITVVELDPGRAAAIGEQLDVQVVQGSGSMPTVLHEAGIHRAEMIAAVTENDEVNLIATLLAQEHGVGQSIVRLQTEELRGDPGDHLRRRVGATLIIDPDADTADEIMELVHVTGADEVYAMGDGDLLVIGAEIAPGCDIVGMTLADVSARHEPDREFVFGAITRGGKTIIPRGDQEIAAGDHVRVLTTTKKRHQVLDLIGVPGKLARRVMIFGGGAIGTRVAEQLQAEGAEVVLVERDHARATKIAEQLHRCVVIEGEITDTDLLLEESVGRMDAVIAATGEDSANVLACAFAAAEGAAYTVAVLHSLSLLPLIRRFGINAALSPRTASANAVLRHVRGGTTAVATFLESDAEVDELEIEPGSPADGATVADLDLPADIIIGAVNRPNEPSEIVRGRTVLRSGDTIVVFARPDALTEARDFFASS